MCSLVGSTSKSHGGFYDLLFNFFRVLAERADERTMEAKVTSCDGFTGN